MKRRTIQILVIVALILLIGGLGYFIFIKRDTVSSGTISTDKITFSDNCGEAITASAEDYFKSWVRSFEKENKLTDKEFNEYITVSGVLLERYDVKSTCRFSVAYDIKKDWFQVHRSDDFFLDSGQPLIQPNNLPLERDTSTSGREGVSTINLHDSFAYKNVSEVVEYFRSKYQVSEATVDRQEFQTFWEKQGSDSSDLHFAVGNGGEPYVLIRGALTSNTWQGHCYNAEVSLVTKEIVFYDSGSCAIY